MRKRIPIGVVLMLSAAFLFHAGVVDVWKQDRLKKRVYAETARLSSREDAFSKAAARRNLELLDSQLTNPAVDAETLVLGAANAYSAGQFDRSVELYERAVAVEGRPELYIYLGDAELRLGRADDAIAHFSRAVAFAPSTIERDELSVVRDEVSAAALALRPNLQ